MKWQKTLLCSALVLSCAQAHAKTIEVQFEVTSAVRGTSYQVYGTEPVVTSEPVAGFAPFLYTIRFDTDYPQVDTDSWYDGSQAIIKPANIQLTDSTPYSASFQTLLPATAPDWQTTRELKFTQRVNTRDPSQVSEAQERQWLEAYAVNGWVLERDEALLRTRTVHHGISLILHQTGPVTSLHGLQPISGEGLADWLRALQGQTLKDVFREYVVETETDAYRSNGYLSKDKGTYLMGDAVIRSVSVVPEPSRIALSLLGVSALAALAGRRRARVG